MSKTRSKKLRNSARDEHCTVNSQNCNHNTETTIYAHLPFDGGMGTKSDDLSGCYACSSCHDIIDKRNHCKEFEEYRDFYLRRAQLRTLKRLIDKRIMHVA